MRGRGDPREIGSTVGSIKVGRASPGLHGSGHTHICNLNREGERRSMTRETGTKELQLQLHSHHHRMSARHGRGAVGVHADKTRRCRICEALRGAPSCLYGERNCERPLSSGRWRVRRLKLPPHCDASSWLDPACHSPRCCSCGGATGFWSRARCPAQPQPCLGAES